MVVLIAIPGLVRAADQPVAGNQQIEAVPCPVDRVVKETREMNARRGKTHDESFYQKVGENFSEQCAMAQKLLAEWAPKWAEYENGKRDDRDGYIIARTLLWQYRILRADMTPAARALSEKLQSLVRTNPDFANIQEDKLSEDRQAEHLKAQDADNERQVAAKWIPPDSERIAEYTGSNFKIIGYQYRVEFFTDSQTKPDEVLTYKHPITIRPIALAWAYDSGSNLLICNDLRGEYSARTEYEQKMVFLRGYPNNSMPWTNSKGKYDNFCGIVGPHGNVIFEFSAQIMPSRLYLPVGIAGNGTRAAVLVGKLVHQEVTDEDDSEAGERIGNIKEVWVWQYPKTLRKIKVNSSDMRGNALIQRLRDGNL